MTDPSDSEAWPCEATDDAFLGGRLVLRQPKTGLRAGLDAVFLAAACRAQPGERVVEAGCGAGAAGLCLAARVPGLAITGLEIDGALAALANGNAARNGMAASFRAIEADVTARWACLEALGLGRDHFDHAIANPPFHDESGARHSGDASRAQACVMPEGGLERWMRFLASAVRAGGQIAVIHRAASLGDILDSLTGRFGAAEIIPLFPKEGAAAIRVILRGRKGSRAPLSLHRGLVLHTADGTATAEAEAVLRHGASLDQVLGAVSTA